MDIEVLKSYWVDLGFAVDQPELRKFELALKQAAQAVEFHTSGIVADVAKWGTAITGALVAIGTGVVAMADHVAMADQKFRLLGLRMHMSTESARKLQLGLDALGASLEEVMWDPELNEHFLQLAEDQDRMAKSLGANFEANMRSIRNLRFEFARLKVAFEFLSMSFINKLFESFGLTLGDVQKNLDRVIDSFEEALPRIATWLSDIFVPVLKDIGDALGACATAYLNLVGLLTDDDSMMSTTLSFENFGKAIEHVADYLANVADAAASLLGIVGHLSNALMMLARFRFADVASELRGAWNDVGNFMLDAFGGDDDEPLASGSGGGPAADKIAAEAKRQGVDPELAKAVAMQESGMRQRDANGNLVRGPGTSATGMFQLTRAAAQDVGVDASDEDQNIRGGVTRLLRLMKQYQGNQAQALAAYYWGSGNVDAALHGYKNWSPKALNYVRGVESREGQNVTIGDIQIQLMQPGATHAEIAHATQKGVSDALAKHNARTGRQIAELGFAG